MFSEPKIIATKDLKVRAYITFYFNGERIREYNGNRLNLPIHPNRSTTNSERNKVLAKLHFEIKKALEKGWNPLIDDKPKAILALDILKLVLDEKLSSSLSWSYKRDLKCTHDNFVKFIQNHHPKIEITQITSQILDLFLVQFDSTGTNFMNKRRILGVIFSSAVNKGYISTNPVLKTQKRKSKATLHKIYTPDQIKKILNYLYEIHPNLHICCLITYGCLLRPHEEVRLLKRNHFNHDLTQITLGGNENKSGRIRTVHVPEYVREILLHREINLLTPEQNILTRTELPFNVSYFSLQWTRAVSKMEKGMVEQNQTIYSFRHSAAINIYRRTKDIHILQQLLGHSNMIVTLKYLRGLGELNSLQHKEFMPIL
jgi:integrase